jgi:pimeloyl-ACP methyl ester carboxylesterase
VQELVSAARPADALAYWMIEIIGVPAEFVDPMRTEPFFKSMEPFAHYLVRDAALLRDFSLPREKLATVTVPTLVLDGGTIPWLSNGVQELVRVLPNAYYRRLEGQSHDIPMDVLVVAVADFLADKQ